jgi:peptidoglycan/LPS O-acetylase OafA/YrhL
VRDDPGVPPNSSASPRHDIPSLDGLRAVSILIVILSHSKPSLPGILANSGLFRYVIGGGLHGVQVFFVISGYLITTLLIREFGRTGAISLKRFYARRSLRIFPPFYVYLGVLGVLWIVGVIPEHLPTFLAAATYTIVYLPHPQGWFVVHSWSLSVEEQFYLLWPMILLWSHRRGKSINVALLVIAVMPLVRVILHLTMSTPDNTRAIVTSGSADTLMVGCLLALLKHNPRFEQGRRKLINGWTAAGMLLLGFVLVPYLSLKLAGTPGSLAAVALGNTITSLCIGGILVYVVENDHSIAGRILNLRLLRHIGVISYSLYIWQQLFTSDTAAPKLYSYLFILIAAELSFWLIEKPVMRLRARLQI